LLVLQRAIRELHDYLARKMREVREFQQSLALMPGQFNHRQLALLENAVKDTNARYTAISHAASHNVTVETARQDLLALQGRGLLTRTKVGRGHVWLPATNIADRLRDV
jgi:Fic family protein